MRVGVIGLGKMGAQIAKRFSSQGHQTVVFDTNVEAVNALAASGGVAAASREELVMHLGKHPVIWLMIPAQYTGAEIKGLCKILPSGAIIIDGGNSDWRNTQKRARACKLAGVELVDIGVSGGVHGLKYGFSLMIGGSDTAVKKVMPLVKALAQPGGYGHFGPTGAGHFVKMVHNAAEYGMMESLAEGYRLLAEGPFKQMDLAKVGEVWEHGSVVRSWLNQLAQEMFTENPRLKGVNGQVAESGEAKWALATAKKLGIAMPAIGSSLKVRQRSQAGEINFATKVLAAMRNKFGGHDINPR